MKTWNDYAELRWYAIIETRKSDGKCGIVMTGYSQHQLKIAMDKMIMQRKQPRTSLTVVEFKPLVNAYVSDAANNVVK